MSGQSQPEYLYGFDYTTASTSDPVYVQSSTVPTQYSYLNQQPSFPQTRYGPIAQSETYLPSQLPNQPTYVSQQGGIHYVQPDSRPLPNITSFSPSQGQPGTPVTILLNSAQDLSSLPPLSYGVDFENTRCMANVVASRWTPSGFEQELSVVTPAREVFSQDETLPLSLVIEDAAGNEVRARQFGHFTYNSTFRGSQPFVPGSVRRARQYTQGASFSPQLANRSSRQMSVQHIGQSGDDHPQYAPHGTVYPQRSAAYGPVPNPNVTQRPTPFPELGGGERESFSQRFTEHASSYSTNEMTKPISRPRISSYSQSESFGGPPQSTPVPGSQQLLQGSKNPQLIRTSTLQQGQNPRQRELSHSQNFNPYRIYPNKAILKIEGDLDSVIEDWSDEENQAYRRLIEFERSQSGNRIRTSFKPVTLEERTAGSICVSCIWWPERQEAVITSVDTIYLLESLVAVRFTVEEKNRIRRNLEGYKPMTVAKLRPESEEFFKIIMGFPNPKPRNIEKDVKVFPWKILKQALKKIIGKYSASYSSTAGMLQPESYGGPSLEQTPSSISSSPGSHVTSISHSPGNQTSTIAEPPRYAPVSTPYGGPLTKPQPSYNPYDDPGTSYWFRPTQPTQAEQYTTPESWQLGDFGRTNVMSALPAEPQPAYAPHQTQDKQPHPYPGRGHPPSVQESPRQDQSGP